MTQKKHLLIFLFIFGSVLTLTGLKLIHNARESLYCPETEGVITESFMDWDRHKKQYATIGYSFIVKGEKKIGFQISAKDTNISNEELLTKYPVGKKVEVYYDPDNPENSLLEPGYSWQRYQAFVLGILFLLVAMGVALLYQEKPQHNERGI